jgi:hypothetical protein
MHLCTCVSEEGGDGESAEALSLLNVSKLFYYETINRELNKRLMYECRCDERLKTKAEGSTRLAYTGLHGGLKHLKIDTRLIDERFASVMGECVIVTLKVCRLYSKLSVVLQP